MTWEGTNYIEKRLLNIGNKLSYVIAPDKSGSNSARDLKTIEEAIEILEWLRKQKPPRVKGLRTWYDGQVRILESRIDRAVVAVKKRSS